MDEFSSELNRIVAKMNNKIVHNTAYEESFEIINQLAPNVIKAAGKCKKIKKSQKVKLKTDVGGNSTNSVSEANIKENDSTQVLSTKKN